MNCEDFCLWLKGVMDADAATGKRSLDGNQCTIIATKLETALAHLTTKMMKDIIEAPFTAEQIKMLETYQAREGVHAYTCTGSTHPRLVVPLTPTKSGLECSECGYSQQWAWRF